MNWKFGCPASSCRTNKISAADTSQEARRTRNTVSPRGSQSLFCVKANRLNRFGASLHSLFVFGTHSFCSVPCMSTIAIRLEAIAIRIRFPAQSALHCPNRCSDSGSGCPEAPAEGVCFGEDSTPRHAEPKTCSMPKGRPKVRRYGETGVWR